MRSYLASIRLRCLIWGTECLRFLKPPRRLLNATESTRFDKNFNSMLELTKAAKFLLTLIGATADSLNSNRQVVELLVHNPG